MILFSYCLRYADRAAKEGDVSANRAKNKPDREHYPRSEAAVE